MERIKFLDALKLFAIFLVLWGHCIQHLLSDDHWDEPLYRIIYAFHMPLFMTISGFFGAGLSKDSFIHVFCKKFRQLLLPALSFGIVLMICELRTPPHAIYSFWFLKSAFLCSIWYFLVSKPKGSGVRIILLVASLLICPFIGSFKICIMYPCYVLGVLLHDHFEWVKGNVKFLLPASGILFVVLLLFWDASFWKSEECNFQFLSGLDVRILGVYKYCYRLLIGFAGTLTFFTLFEHLSRFVPESRVGIIFCKWGRQTLGIYCLQTFILETFLRDRLNFDRILCFNFIIAPMISFGVLLLCLGCIRILRLSRWTSWAFLGSALKAKEQ